MRKIKFRFWDKPDKKMWFSGQEGESIGDWTFQSWFDSTSHELKAAMVTEIDVGYNKPMMAEINLIPMQYIGIEDKNGKEIYEGDIVRIKGHALQRDKRGIGIDIDGNYVVKWSEKMELILAPSPESKEGCLLSKNLHYIEVIGNIFQDGDLLRDS